MKSIFLLFIFFTASVLAQTEIVLSTTHNQEIWEGDQIPANLKLPKTVGELNALEFTDGIYIVNAKEMENGLYDLKVIITDREKFLDLNLKDSTEKLFRVKTQGFNFKKDKIEKGSFVFVQELNSHKRVIFLTIALIIVLVSIVYYLRAKKKKELILELANKKNHLISLVSDIDSKEKFNIFFDQKNQLKNFFVLEKKEIDEYIKFCQGIVYKNELSKEEQDDLIKKSLELATKLEASNGL